MGPGAQDGTEYLIRLMVLIPEAIFFRKLVDIVDMTLPSEIFINVYT